MTSLRGLLAVVILFLTANAATVPDCARADVQYFPIPAVSSSKNDGNDAGLIVPILITEPDGELKYIVAPMLIQNSIVGTRGTLNVFRYEPGGGKFDLSHPTQSISSTKWDSVTLIRPSVKGATR